MLPRRDKPCNLKASFMRNFKNKKVVIMGLGLQGGGVGAAKFFCSQGADVLVTDLKNKDELKDSLEKIKDLPVTYTLGKHKEEDFLNSDLIIKNPGVGEESPFLKTARKAGIPVETDINIFFELTEALVVGVTGTKGKSTIASFIYKILKTHKKDVFLAGNIGVSPLEIIPKVKKGSWVVLELSSFELEHLEKSPEIAVVCSIYPDHLNRYKNLKEYVKAKKTIYKYQGPKDFLVLNYDDPLVKKMAQDAKSQILFYSKESLPLKKFGCFLKDGKIFFKKEALAKIEDLRIKGDHNISNALAALTVAKILRIPSKKIKKAMSSFKGVKDREQLVLERDGIKYVNDTTATIPEAVCSALERFSNENIVLIAGGENKGVRYEKMAEAIEKNAKSLVLLPGSASEELKKHLKKIKVIPAFSMKEAVKKAKEKAEEGDIVLLSPGAASFNLFDNEFDRGEQFIKSATNG